jgi:hypothetical protein
VWDELLLHHYLGPIFVGFGDAAGNVLLPFFPNTRIVIEVKLAIDDFPDVGVQQALCGPHSLRRRSTRRIGVHT